MKKIISEQVSIGYLQNEEFQLFTTESFTVISFLFRFVLFIHVECDFWISLKTYEHCK